MHFPCAVAFRLLQQFVQILCLQAASVAFRFVTEFFPVRIIEHRASGNKNRNGLSFHFLKKQMRMSFCKAIC